MSYTDYRLKINGTKVPNTLMVRGSYSCQRPLRVAEKYEDASGVQHEITFNSKKTTIKFQFRPHTNAEHSQFTAFLASLTNVSVNYYDDTSGTYLDGTFRIKDIDWKHENVIGTNIEYGATNIELTEY